MTSLRMLRHHGKLQEAEQYLTKLNDIITLDGAIELEIENTKQLWHQQVASAFTGICFFNVCNLPFCSK